MIGYLDFSHFLPPPYYYLSHKCSYFLRVNYGYPPLCNNSKNGHKTFIEGRNRRQFLFYQQQHHRHKTFYHLYQELLLRLRWKFHQLWTSSVRPLVHMVQKSSFTVKNSWETVKNSFASAIISHGTLQFSPFIRNSTLLCRPPLVTHAAKFLYTNYSVLI